MQYFLKTRLFILKEKLNINFFCRFFLALTLLSIPFSIRTFLHDARSFTSGMFSETTAVFLNITDIFLWLAVICFLLQTIFTKPNPLIPKKKCISHYNIIFWGIIFLLINFLTVFFSKDFVLSFFFFIKILEGCILVFLLTQQILSKQKIGVILICLGFFEGGLAILQFILQHDLGLYFLGEPHLTAHSLGTAKMDIAGNKLIRGYGTFSHPNILAAFFVILFFYLDNLKFQKLKYLLLIPLFFTFSRGAFLAVFIGLIVKILCHSGKTKRCQESATLNKLIGLFFITILFSGILYYFFPERLTLGESFTERIELIKTSWQMFLQSPFGIGNANFIFYQQDFSLTFLKPWEIQPVHNLYLLVLNENGFLGLLFFGGFLFSFLFQLFRKNKNLVPLFLAVLILGFFDHYFWDLDTGKWLFWMSIGICGQCFAK